MSESRSLRRTSLLTVRLINPSVAAMRRDAQDQMVGVLRELA